MGPTLSDLERRILLAAVAASQEPSVACYPRSNGRVRVRAGRQTFDVGPDERPVLDLSRVGLLKPLPGGFHSVTEEGRRIAGRLEREDRTT